MKIGDYVRTPRFLNVKISKMFQTENEARKNGFTETTHYWNDPEYGVLGKMTDLNQMVFAGYMK